MSVPTNFFINNPDLDCAAMTDLPFPDGEERSKTIEHKNRLSFCEKSQKSNKIEEN